MPRSADLSPTCAFHEYAYELRRDDDEVVETGLVRLELELLEGDPVAMSGQLGIVRKIIPAHSSGPHRLVVELR